MTLNDPAGQEGKAKTDRRADPLAPLRPILQTIHKRMKKIETSRRRARCPRLIESLSEELFDLTCELDALSSLH